jgi:hypothetical protein
VTGTAVPPGGSSGTAGSGPSVLRGAAGLVADAIESALAAGLEGLRSPDAEPAAEPPPSPPARGRTEWARPRDHGASRQVPRRVGPPPAPADWRGAARRRAGTATDLAASVAARIANGTLERLDLNAIIDRVDVGRVIAKVDIEGVLNRVDLDALLGKVDLDRLVQRLDVGALANEAMEGIDIGEVIRESTASIGSDTVDAVRDQAMRADGLVARVVDRALRRPTGAG